MEAVVARVGLEQRDGAGILLTHPGQRPVALNFFEPEKGIRFGHCRNLDQFPKGQNSPRTKASLPGFVPGIHVLRAIKRKQKGVAGRD